MRGISQLAALQQLFDKSGVRTRSQLVRVAIERSIETGVAPRSPSSQ